MPPPTWTGPSPLVATQRVSPWPSISSTWGMYKKLQHLTFNLSWVDFLIVYVHPVNYFQKYFVNINVMLKSLLLWTTYCQWNQQLILKKLIVNWLNIKLRTDLIPPWELEIMSVFNVLFRWADWHSQHCFRAFFQVTYFLVTSFIACIDKLYRWQVLSKHFAYFMDKRFFEIW